MQSDKSAPRKARSSPFAVQITVLVFLSFLLAAVSVNAWAAGEGRKQAEIWYAHTLDVLLETSRLRAGVYAEMRGERGYLLTHNPRFLDPYYFGRGQVAASGTRLTALTRDNRGHVAKLARLRGQLRSYEALLAHTIALEQEGGHGAALDIVRAGIGKHHIDAVLATIDSMDRAEKVLLRQRRVLVADAMVRTERYQYALSLVGFLLVLLAGWAAFSARRAQAAAAHANGLLERLAASDPLTGLANRRAFFDRLDSDGARETCSAVAILDVDHFKRVNDRHGHPVGDRVLREIADIPCGAFRASDVIGRIGGEEFAILMPGTAVDQAIQACERARTAVNAHVVTLDDGNVVQVSVSIGVAVRMAPDTVEACITKADAALYEAKAGGRNRVLLAA